MFFLNVKYLQIKKSLYEKLLSDMQHYKIKLYKFYF